MGLLDRLRHLSRRTTEAAAEPQPAPASTERRGYEYGIPRGGLTEYVQGSDGSGNTRNRTQQLQELYDAYLACPWSSACVDTIARTITAGGVRLAWTGDDGEGDQEVPPIPPAAVALQRLLDYVNPREDIRQLMRGVIADLLVFADAYVEVVWFLGLPVALYSLDAPSMRILSDEHGTVTGYVQITDVNQRAVFAANEVIHISLDAPRGGLTGVSPTQKALLSITTWLFYKASQKEIGRKGIPPTIHADMPAGMSEPEIRRWDAQYRQRNLGTRNIGAPIETKGGATLKEMQPAKLLDVAKTLDQARDEMLSTYGVPPAQVGVIESGNLGGGTGESQFKSFQVNTCAPYAQAVLEKFNFALTSLAFGITDWEIQFGDMDWRDSAVIENIRDQRLRNGSWTLNRYREDIGEAPVDGGDAAVLVDRENLVMWRDMDAASKAGIAAKLKGTALEPGEPQDGQPVSVEKPEPAPVPAALAPFAGQDNPPADIPPGGDGSEGKPPPEEEVWRARYRRQLRELLAAGARN